MLKIFGFYWICLARYQKMARNKDMQFFMENSKMDKGQKFF